MTIQGLLLNGRARVTVNGVPLTAARSQRVWNHSPDGFAWGYGGSGPAQLALALLLEAGLTTDQAVRLHQHFKFDVIARLPFGQPFILDLDVRQWIRAHVV